MARNESAATRDDDRVGRRWHRRVIASSAAVALTMGGTVAVASAAASPRAASQLQSASASPYAKVLANAKGDSLYILSVESKGKLHCKTSLCLMTWPPYLVKASTKTIAKGAGVKGKIGFVKRSSTMKQVTFNGYPVYRFSGDTGAHQATGENIVADGGTWTLTSAPATTTKGTPVAPQGGGGTSGGW
jgi:predicted lipoprotein with Yx(FWY)xxD motif